MSDYATEVLEMPTILLIDDEPVLRRTFRHFLEGAGYQVAEAADGAEGVAVCESVHPDLVITDVTMPVLQGGAVVAEVRRRLGAVPVIVLSGRGESGCDAQGIRFLPKPVNKASLLSEISDLLVETEGASPPKRESSGM